MTQKWPSRTIRKDTTMGTAYITLIGEEKLESVIINLGKVGSDSRGLSEALGRLITLGLKKDQLAEIKQELKNIGSDRSGAIPTLPHAIFEVLEETK